MRYLLLILIFILCILQGYAVEWKAKWIEAQNCQESPSTWQVFRKSFNLEAKPKALVARIAVDSKYWLWINGELVVFEGGLKRGPSPTDTYYDEVDIAPYMRRGHNTIAVLTWFFGKEGFSHKNSGKAGLLFDAYDGAVGILSDATWEADVYEAYGVVEKDGPNHRLPESAIRFDGKKDLGKWYGVNYDRHFPYAKVIDTDAENEIYGKLVPRPIPLFKYSQLQKYVSTQYDSSKGTLRCKLPYDAQVTPYLKIKATAGKVIDMRTDCFNKAGENSIRAEYVTRDGIQEYESLGWMNGNWVEYTIPDGVEIIDVKYRESGYDTEIAGSFECNDPFWNELWKRSARTLYVNMRDTYFDCPDRERAQWWGDMVNDIHENFYVLTPSSWQLIKKGMFELMNWQKPDGVIYSPIPAGNWSKELPCQMLMSVGLFGFYSQYYYSGESDFIAPLYDRIHKYLHEVWSVDDDGFVYTRRGGWSWADWGTHIDLHLITNEWYYMALTAEQRFAEILNRKGDEKDLIALLEKMERNFDRRFWKGTSFRSDDYKEVEDDDRAQALAVVSGLSSPDKDPALLEVFKKSHYASPLLELYVQEAMFKMGQGEEALKRAKQQYSNMLSFKEETTVFEFWDYKGKGGTNHAWASGMTVILARDVCGIRPTSPGFRTFDVAPQLSGLKWVNTSLVTRYGKIILKLKEDKGSLRVSITVPEKTESDVKWNGKTRHLKAGKYTFTMR